MKKLEQTNSEKYIVKCRRCHNNKGMIRKYNLRLCRRCFKDIALEIGFHKYG